MNSEEEELYQTLYEDLEVCRDYLRQIAAGMVKGDVSKYPIFVALRGEADLDLGLPVVNRNDFDIVWNINASHLEELVHKGIVSRDKAPDFIRAYKNPMEFMCVFIAEEGIGSFVFMPYVRQRPDLN